jgi:dihydrofolate reductase
VTGSGFWIRLLARRQTILVGRNTFESIGVRPGMEMIVLTRSIVDIPNCRVIHSIEDLLAIPGDLWISGGAEIYEQLLPACRELYLTTILGHYEGDAVFPEFASNFREESVIMRQKDFYVTKYVNKKWKELAESASV